MLRPQPLPPVPEETARVARAALSPRHPYLRRAAELGELFADEGFADLFPTHGQPGLAPWRVALVTILQFAEGLTDRQAAAAVRGRIDWKYVLRLALADGGFDASVLSEFRGRLLAHDAAPRLFDALLACCRERGFVKAGGRQRTDPTDVWGAVRGLHRLELVVEAMRHALNSLAVAAPAWVQAHADVAWADRYVRRADDERLPGTPAARAALALAVGADDDALLRALHADDAPPRRRALPAAETLRRIWAQHDARTDDAIARRAEADLPPAGRFVSSPDDEDVHLAQRRSMHGIGYKVHVTEACDDARPPLIVHVETTTAPAADGDMPPVIHAALEEEHLLPRERGVATGYLDAEWLVSSKREYGVDLVGPTRLDDHWQAGAHRLRPGGLPHRLGAAPGDLPGGPRQQQLDAGAGPADQPRHQGQVLRAGLPPLPEPRALHALAEAVPRRTSTIRERDEFAALLAARRRARTGAYRAAYAKRAGCEGTLARGVRRRRQRRTRYRGEERTHLGHVLTAAGLNFVRLGEWFAGTPAPSRVPRRSRH